MGGRKTSLEELARQAERTKYKLTYFQIQGLGEPVRWLLLWGNLDWEDNRVPKDVYAATIKQTIPFGKLPLLETPEGYKLHQHTSICRYLARRLNLVGKNDWEAAQIDMIIDTLQDFRGPLHSYHYDTDPVTKAPKKGPIHNEIVPYYLGKFEEMVKSNNGFIVGNQITWADIYFISISDYLQKMSEEDFFTNYPNLKALKEKIVSNPKIKKWIETRPENVF